MNLSDVRASIEAVNSWAILVHAKYSREDRINPDRRQNKDERATIAECAMSIMKACTDILDDLAATEDAHDEIGEADRDNFKRDFEG